MSPATDWWVYVLVAAGGGRTYVGVTTDLERRLDQHNGVRKGGARATRAHRPWTVGAQHGPYPTRGEAQRVEHALKRERGSRRLAWVPGEASRRAARGSTAG